MILCLGRPSQGTDRQHAPAEGEADHVGRGVVPGEDREREGDPAALVIGTDGSPAPIDSRTCPMKISAKMATRTMSVRNEAIKK